jgi:uncharacterized protein YunC (DUF1805 family)
MTSKVIVRTLQVKGGQTSAQGIEASWDSGQWVAIICNKGMIGCGAFDVKLMEEHEQVIAVAHGKLNAPLITCEDLLDAIIEGTTKLARKFGVKEGMTCREAVDILS